MHLSINYKITLFLVIILSLLSPGPSFARELTSIERIANAYRNGEIDYTEALNYRVAAVLRPEGLPEAYRSKVPIKSATTILLEARSNRHLLSTENARLLARGRVGTLTDLYGSSISLLSYMSRGRHFRIHYTRSGANAVPPLDADGDNIPDYVEKFADILDHVYDTEINEMGYNAAPSDGSEGGDCLLDVYLADLRTNPNFGPAYGITLHDTGDPASDVYMIFENDFADFLSNLNPGGLQEGDMKVTAAHEFFHTIQFQITDDTTNYGWWMEASATWMEDRVYPEVDDYVNYIGTWFSSPDLSLDTYNRLFEYGTSVWVKHMTEKYGSKFVYDVWNKIKEGNSALSALSAVENSLTDRGTTLEEELKELRVADVTFQYDDGVYEDGAIYRTWDKANPIGVPYTNTDFTQVGTVNYADIKLGPLAAKYYSYSPPPGGGPGALKIDFTGDGSIRVMVIGLHSTGYDVTEILPDNTDSGTITVAGFSSGGPYTGLVVIPLNYSTTDQGNVSGLAATYTTTLPDNTADLALIPQPGTSIVTGDAAGDLTVIGRQQYFIIQKDKNGGQILESGTTWASDSSPVVVDDNGLATASAAIPEATLTASIGAISKGASLSVSGPVSMPPGTPRNCTIQDSSGGSRCFIATAAFGSPLHPYVKILREFRDRYLLTNRPGRDLVSLYYLYSPPIAEKIAGHAFRRVIVQFCLIPAIIFGGFMIKTTMAEKIVVNILLIIMLVIARQSRSNLIIRLLRTLRLLAMTPKG